LAIVVAEVAKVSLTSGFGKFRQYPTTEKVTPLLRLKYQKSIADAVADLSRADEIAKLFAGFQKYLYQRVVAQVAQASARVLRHG
jgi:hypothetical protein